MKNDVVIYQSSDSKTDIFPQCPFLPGGGANPSEA